jgi:hypothetical protein
MKRQYTGLRAEVIPLETSQSIITGSPEECKPNFEAWTLTDMGGWTACKEGYDGSGNWVGVYLNEPPD